MTSPDFLLTTWLVRRRSARRSAMQLMLWTRSDPFFPQEERRTGFNLRHLEGRCRNCLRLLDSVKDCCFYRDCSILFILLFLALQGRFVMS